MRYSIPEYPNCMLDSDEDLKVLFSLLSSNGIKQVDVVVNDCNNGEGCCVNLNGNCSNNDDLICLDATQKEWRLEYDKTKEMMSSFCPVIEKVLLSAPWARGIVGVSKKFEGGAQQFRTVLCKYTFECGFEFIYVKNDSTHVTAHCSHKSSGCGLVIHARQLSSNGYFYIKKLNNVHSCGSAVRTFKNRHMTSDLVGGLIVDDVRTKPLKRPIDVISEFKSKYGLDISYHQAWMGVEKARGEIYGDYSLSFDQLHWYVDAISGSNHDSCIVLECDPLTNHFKRIYIAFGACINEFNHYRPLLFLDGTFLKGRHKGILLSAIGNDGNQGLFSVCFAIVEAENKENRRWFMDHLASILDSTREITFLSDRNPGLLEAVNLVFSTAYHGYCIQHLKQNLRYHLWGRWNTYRGKMVSHFDKCAYVPTVEIFHESLNDLLDDGGTKVKHFIDDLPFEHWTNAYFKGCCYRETISNAAESFNNWTREERQLLITNLLDTIRVKLMN